jgi:hypothetical protein
MQCVAIFEVRGVRQLLVQSDAQSNNVHTVNAPLNRGGGVVAAVASRWRRNTRQS